MKKIKLSKKEKEAQVKEFNEKYPIGTPVLHWSYVGINRDGTETREEIRATKIRNKAFIANCGSVVLFIKGKSGYVHINHIEVIEDDD